MPPIYTSESYRNHIGSIAESRWKEEEASRKMKWGERDIVDNFWRTYFSKELTVSEGYVYAVQGLVMFMLAWAARFMNTDYEGAGVIAIAIAYIFRKNNKNCIMSSVIVLTITNVMEAVAFLDVLLVERYNGQRGLKLKYIFYIIYPLHLIIYYFIARKLGIFPGKIGFPGTF